MNPLLEKIQLNTRRHFLKHCGMGLGALAQLLTPEVFALKAPRIRCFPETLITPQGQAGDLRHLTGSPPHLDLWDYKPELVKRTDQDCPDEFVKGKMFAFTSGTPS